MKPIRLSFQNFGSYRELQQVDFTGLYDAGLFLITGDTGGGKTTILDAMCCALYGCSSGDQAEDLFAMRCRQAGEKDETMVSFTFETRGQQYTFTRRLVKKRVNFDESYSLTVLQDGVDMPLLANLKKSAMNQQAERIIGLTYQQFSQIIILPQGRFQEFLTSDSEAKRRILSQLFQLQDWDRLLEVMKEHLNQRKARREQLKGEMDMLLRQLQAESVEGLQTALVEEKARISAQEKELLALADRRKGAIAAYEAAIEADKDFAALAAAQKALAQLEAMGEERAQAQSRLERLLHMREIETDFHLLQKQQARLQEAEAVLIQRTKAMEAQAARAQQETQALQALEAQTATMEGEKQRQMQLTQAMEVYQRRDALVQEGLSAREKSDAINRQVEATARALADETAALEQLRIRRNQAESTYAAMLRTYLSGISAVLATELKDEAPCPVCGSTHHPRPAQPIPGMVTDAQLQAAESDKEKAAKAAEAKEQEEKALRSQLEGQRAQKLQADAALESLRAQVKDLDKQLIPGLKDVHALQGEIDRLQAAVDAHQRQLTRATQQKADADQLLHTLTGAAQGAQEEAQEAKRAFMAGEESFSRQLTHRGVASLRDYEAMVPQFPQIAQLQQAQTVYDTNLKAARQDVAGKELAVAGKEAPQKERLEQEKNSAEAAYLDARDRLANGKSAHAQRVRLMTRYEQLLPLWIKEEAEHQELTAFYGRLSPNSGISLSRFVMGIYFQGIVEEANRQLQKVHGGRYQLQISGVATGRKMLAGLELEVLDSTHPGARSVKSLSGGEQFLASLCLAIGLSSCLQAREGATINAMFVDEGFGTLDSASLEDAMEVLNVARAGHAGRGLVGIISHVDALKAVIYSRIEVTRNTKGSQLTMRA